jgi:ATP-dependent Lon protease
MAFPGGTLFDPLNDDDPIEIPPELPLLPVRDVVVFPYMILPLFVGRDKSIEAVERAVGKNRLLMLVAQRDVQVEEPEPPDLYDVGTVAMVMRMLKLPDGRVKVLVQGVTKARIVEYTGAKPFYTVRVKRVEEAIDTGKGIEAEALVRSVKTKIEAILPLKNLPPEMVMITNAIEEPGRLADLVLSNLRLRVVESQKLLEVFDPVERLKLVHDLLDRELEVSRMQEQIQNTAKEEMSRSQREYYLREQLRVIKNELGEKDDRAGEVDDLRGKIRAAKMPPHAEKEALKQAARLERMHPDAAEASMLRGFLDWMIELPWSKKTRDNLDLTKAKEVLDADHAGLQKVKERILEYLSVKKLRKSMKGPILCFVGPPGVGKTSLGKSIAKAMGRQFVRVSLGGVRDEAEIRGHRRTYVGALPGRIVQGMKSSGTLNPVFMLDEIDKVGTDFRGDPTAALLEVLDPAQNSAFSDHYLNVPFDLSQVLWVTTANLLDPIPAALRDRMEIIRIAGYTHAEKKAISRGFLIPRQLEEHGLSSEQIGLADGAVARIITHYTREAGVRNLEREIGAVCRKVARRVAEGEASHIHITAGNLHRFLGAPRYLPEVEQERDEVGIATGLAWTEVGGEVLFVEVSITKGRGELILTGQLGDVMKESAQAALSFARSRARHFHVDEETFGKRQFHVHVPAGAIPKDGPSAGVTMATALISALTGIPVRKDVAMTGEITLRGRVLPIGGLKEKALAAVRMGIRTLLVPESNRKDLEEVPRDIQLKMRFVFVKSMDEVLERALVDPVRTRSIPEPPPRRGAPKHGVPIPAYSRPETRRARKD